jgi:PAS domain S-box-containing protein
MIGLYTLMIVMVTQLTYVYVNNPVMIKTRCTMKESTQGPFNSIIENVSDVIAVLDADGTIRYVNPAAKHRLGYPTKQMQGKNIAKFIHPDDLPTALEAFQHRLEHPQAPTGSFMQVRLHHKNGQWRDFEGMVDNLRDDPQITRIVLIARDVTERKRAEEALNQRAKELHSLQANVLEITAPHVLSNLLSTIVERAANLLDADSGGLYLCDPERQEARCVVSYNTTKDYTGTVLRYGEGAAGLVAQTGEPLIIDDYRTWSGSAVVYSEEKPFERLISAPMLWQGQVIGVIHVLRSEGDTRFTQANLELLSFFANHAAIAVINTRQMENLKLELTERKRAQEALRESEHRYQTLTEISPVGIFRTDLQGKTTYVNPRWCEISGLATAQALGNGWLSVVHPEDRDALAAGWRQTTQDQSTSVTEYRFLRPDGTLAWVMGQAVPERDSSGKIVGSVGTITDITERKRAEVALQESEARYRSLAEAAHEMIIVVDHESQIKYTNQFAAEQLGKLPHELIGKSIAEIFPPEIAKRQRANLQKVFQYGESFYTEAPSVFQGHTIWLGTWLSPIKTANGKVNAVLVISRDITERKQAEEKLRESEEKFKKAFYTSPDSININRLEDGMFVSINNGFTQITGYSEDDVIGKTSLEINIWNNPEDRSGLVAGLKQSGEVQNLEAPFRRKNGDITYGLMSAAIIDLNGTPHIISVTRDITERKQAEESLRQSENKLRALFAAMTDAIIVYDSDGRYLEIAPTNPINLYITPDEMLGKTVAEVLPPEQAELCLKAIRQALKTQELTNVEYSLPVRKKVLWFSALISPLSTDSVIWVARDITERRRAEQEIEHRLAELEAINRISTALRGAQTLDEMLPCLLDETLNMLGTDAGVIWLYDLPGNKIFRSAARGWFTQLKDVKITIREGIAGHVFQTGNAHISPEFVQDALTRKAALPQIPAGWGGICVPIHTEQETIGVLFVSVQLPRQLGPEEANLLTTISEIAGNAFRRAGLHEQTEQQVRRLAALRSIDMAISSVFDLRLTLNILLDHIVTQLKVDAANILLYNPHTQILEHGAGRGFWSTTQTHLHLRLGESLAGRAALERRMVSVADLRTQLENSSKPELLSGENFIAYFAVPLITKGEIKGVLEIFHRAPLDPNEEWLSFLETLAGQAAIAIEDTRLFEDLQRSNLELELAYDATIEGWSKVLDLRDADAEGHTRRVAEMTIQVAQRMDMSETELVHVRRGTLLHDIGKMGVPDSILSKPGPLSDEEWVVMRKHPQFAYDMLYSISYLRQALDIPYCHHERWDGTGYPRGLKGEQIPLAARVFAVVDVWDALNSDRPYRKAWTSKKALDHIRSESGKHFDPQVVRVFLEFLDDYFVKEKN